MVKHDYWEGHDWNEDGCRTCRAEKAEADVARLREALKRVVELAWTAESRAIADAALKEQP